MTLDGIMQEVEERKQLQEDVEWQQEEAVSENISLEDFTIKHLSLVLEYSPDINHIIMGIMVLFTRFLFKWFYLLPINHINGRPTVLYYARTV